MTQAKADYTQDWQNYGTVDGQIWGAPFGASVKSFVWYSPKMFKDNGWEIPTTWDQLLALSDTIAATGIKPWCVGFESGAATGWPGTDWIEDIMLRTAGPEAYLKWVANELKFDSPEVRAAFDEAAKILKNDKYVNGGYGDVKSIPVDAFQEGGLPILKGKCAHAQAGVLLQLVLAQGHDGCSGRRRVRVLLPGQRRQARPRRRRDRRPVQRRAAGAVGGSLPVLAGLRQPPDRGLQLRHGEHEDRRGGYANPINKLSAEIIADPQTVFRFDASDLMPGAVGSGTFWTGMVDWINGASTEDVTTAIQKSWPAP